MDKILIKRGSIILGLILIILGLTYACSLIIERDNNPRLTDPNGTFVSVNGISITNQEWFDEAKAADGFSQLLNMIDERLLATEINAITQDEIDETVLRLTYGTSDLDEIERLSEIERANLEKDYLDLIVISGFDPDDRQSVERFIRLTSARETKAKELIRDRLIDAAGVDELIDLPALRDFYAATEKGSLQAVVLRFRSLNELNGILRLNNLVLNFEGGMGKYFGETPIEDVPTTGFDENNTRKLTDDEVLAYYLLMDKTINPFLGSLPSDATPSELAALGIDRLNYTFSDMLDERRSEMTTLANLLFDTLRASEVPYSTSARTVGSERVLAYIFENTPALTLDELTSTEDIENAFLETQINREGAIQNELARYRQSLGLQIHDQELASNYLQTRNIDAYSENRDRSIVASLDDFTISMDDFFEYLSRRVGALYSLDLIRNQLLLESDYFEALYGRNRDLFRNNSEPMVAFRDQIRQDKLAFSNGLYAQFGFSPDRFTWEEFLRAGYGLNSEFDYLLTLSLTDVRRAFVNDRLSFEMAEPYINEYKDNYLSLEVRQLLLLVDMDQNFAPDNFDDYYDSLSPSEQANIERLVAQFENLVAEEVDGGSTLQEILTAFNNGLRGEDPEESDYSKWAQFKNQGFYLTFENLSAENSLNLERSRSFVRPFLDGLIDFYQRYQLPENIDEDSLLNDRVIRTQFGLHMILGEPSPNFERPTHVLTASDIDDYINFLSDVGNNFQSQEALTAALNAEFGEDVVRAITAFYSPFYDRALGNTHFNALLIDEIVNDVNFTIDADYHSNVLRTLGDIFLRRSFPVLLSELE